ncbi:RNA chaperone ProQ [Pasteurellaceae bacterium Pebbles2]|nr:RNA chaperone ProQ [Pasteurellaceae bacterium Pebbles2]
MAYLAKKFPLCFCVEGEAKPLKIGLFQDLAEALADDENVSKTQLRHALRQYTSNWRYLHGCRLGAERVDLQGNAAGVLEQEHVDHAQQQLAAAKAVLAEKRAAEKAAAKENTKKRVARKPQNKANPKFTKKPTNAPKNKPAASELVAVDFASLKVGHQVKVKVGDNASRAQVLDIAKDVARVQLANGLVMNVTADRLFA